MILRNDKCPCQSGKKYKKCCFKILPISQKDYLNNNFELINFYSSLYSENIDIDKILNQLKSGIFTTISLIDLYRFRVFIDSVILLFNREKLERDYFRKKVIYNKFFQYLNKDTSMQGYLTNYVKILREKSIYNVPKEINSFYFENYLGDTRPYDQLARVRNAFAHMNYGYFEFIKNNNLKLEHLLTYAIYNRDSKTNKSTNHGYILEPVLHRFIQAYFTNYSTYGVPYKHSWFELNSDEKFDKNSQVNINSKIVFNSLSYKDTIKYEGDSNHDMNAFTDVLSNYNRDELLKYIEQNKDKFEHSKENISPEQIKELLSLISQESKSDEVSNELFSDSIKFLYDFETEFSNFLVHLMQLNDRIIDYISTTKSNSSSTLLKSIFESVEELKEDKFKWLPFKYMFPLLDVFNICLRLEDDDLQLVEVNKVNVSGFIFDKEKVEVYNSQNDSLTEKSYILERLRNSIAHGHINIELNESGNIEYHFTDIWNNRKEGIYINYKDLSKFTKQYIFKDR